MSIYVMKRALSAIEQCGGGSTRYNTLIADLKREIKKGEDEHTKKTNAVIQDAVNRFLSWELPSNFNPDCYISFNHPGGGASWPTGTNLLNAEQAKWMIEYIFQEH